MDRLFLKKLVGVKRKDRRRDTVHKAIVLCTVSFCDEKGILTIED